MKSNYFYNNKYILKLMWKIKKERVIGEFLQMMLNYVFWIFYDIIFIKYLVNALEMGKEFKEIMIFLVLTVLGFIIPSITSIWFDCIYKPKSNADIFETVNTMLFEKATHVELECYENTEFYNQFTLAMKDCELRLTQIIANQSEIISSTISSIIALYYMFSIDPFVIIFIAGPLIGNFVFGKFMNQNKFKMNKESIPFVRQMDYVNRTLYLADYAKEIRMTDIFQVLKQIYENGFTGVLKKIKEYSNKQIVLTLLRNIFTFVVIFQGVIFYSLYRVMVSHTMTLSGFTVLFSAMTAAAWMIIMSSDAIIKSYNDSLYIANLKGFLEYEPKIDELQEGLSPKKDNEVAVNEPMISFNNISFTYCGQEMPTLKNVSMTINKGEKIAIVGHNGAGKTTLIKLLMRLYDVTEGDIIYCTHNIKEMNLSEYRKLFGTAFQDYQVFSMTVAENVLMRKPESVQDYLKVEDCLKRAGVFEKICSLPHKMDTVLTKEFEEEGAVLSGGELQKIAVARAFAKEYQIAVFDEPSSALDPVAEYQLYENILKGCEGKTIIFISHRLSTAVLADKVYLFENGEIVEQGIHMDLMKQNGKYADMFRKQAENYIGGMHYEG